MGLLDPCASAANEDIRGAAFLWVGYGVLTHAAPVVVANCIVVMAAGFSLWRQKMRAAVPKT